MRELTCTCAVRRTECQHSANGMQADRTRPQGGSWWQNLVSLTKETFSYHYRDLPTLPFLYSLLLHRTDSANLLSHSSRLHSFWVHIPKASFITILPAAWTLQQASLQYWWRMCYSKKTWEFWWYVSGQWISRWIYQNPTNYSPTKSMWNSAFIWSYYQKYLSWYLKKYLQMSGYAFYTCVGGTGNSRSSIFTCSTIRCSATNYVHTLCLRAKSNKTSELIKKKWQRAGIMWLVVSTVIASCYVL